MIVRPRILLAVTVDFSFILIRGFPEYLVDHGWDVHLVSSPGPGLEAYRGLPNVTVHELPMRRAPHPVADIGALISWMRLLRQVRPDVTSVGTPKAALLGGIAARIMRVPFRVYLMRGLRLETSAGVQRRVLTMMERLTCRNAHRVVCVSPSLLERAIALRLVKPNKAEVVGYGSSNGVDLDAHDPNAFSTSTLDELRKRLTIVPNVPVIGFVGRLTADKGLRALAQARAELEAQGLDHQLLIVGGVDDASGREALVHLRTGGRAPIETGVVADTGPYYQLMDVFCLPSLREGMPNAVLEAAASGLPAVTTLATGCRDSVIDGVTGSLVPADDGLALGQALAALLRDPESRRTMGQAARSTAEIRYARPIVWDGYECLYSEGTTMPGRSRRSTVDGKSDARSS